MVWFSDYFNNYNYCRPKSTQISDERETKSGAQIEV